jgi:microcompartment protein CcmL/EutN
VVTDPLVVSRPAVAALELATIARGIVALDAMAKRAETTIVASRTLSPGRYLILLSGEVAEIEEAMDAGAGAAGEDVVDQVIIRDPHRDLRGALSSQLQPPPLDSIAIVEASAVSSTLLAVDRTLKEADVRLLELRLGAGLSGKGVFTLTGPLHMIEAAKEVIHDVVHASRLIRLELIAQPHPDLPRHLLGAEPAAVRGPAE